MSERTPRGSALSESELKARLAQAEVHFSHYRWDDAIATFEAVLAAHPDLPAATQGWANAVEQKSIDEELSQALARARAGLAERRFDEALAALNQAQARGALSHILKYHSEIDGLRSEAQEGQEWQRRIDAARREAETLAGRRRFDQALEVIDNTLRPLSGRGWERLGERLVDLRERLWAERDVSERFQFAESAFERQDYRLATELAAALHEEAPGRPTTDRDDAGLRQVAALHERARGAWARIQDQLAAVNEALAQDRNDDALALLAALRSEHPHNPDWQAIALRVYTDQGRRDAAAGRAAMVDHSFEEAAEAFERAYGAFTTTVEVFSGHPTAPGEQTEAAALRETAIFAAQAQRDRAAFRWEASLQGWLSAREQLQRAVAARGRDLGEVVAVVGAMLGETQAALEDLERARLLLADGRQALEARDAGRAREAFRGGLVQVEGGRWGDAADLGELREQLAAGLRESERVQREVRKLLGQAERAKTGERLTLLRRAYEQWETAPGLVARLAEELLAAASAKAEAGDEDAALVLCGHVLESSGAPAGALEAAQRMTVGIRAQRDAKAALESAAARLHAAKDAHPPSSEPYSEALALLDAAGAAFEEAKDLAAQYAALREQAEGGRDRAVLAQPLVEQSEALAAQGEWRGSAAALAAAQEALGPLASPALADRLAQLRGNATAVDDALSPALDALGRAEGNYGLAADGDLDAVDWEALDREFATVRKALRAAPRLPSPLPPAWHETKARADALARRGHLLRGVHEKVAAGRALDAIPILQADTGLASDQVVQAVLVRLLEETASDAVAAARGWLGQATGALGRGELATAEAYLGLARSYAAAAPQVGPEIRRVERQVASLAQVRSATVEGRERAASGEFDAALACYRRALELATDGEAGLPASARHKLNRLLNLEEELGRGGQAGGDRGAGTAGDLVQALVDGEAADVLVNEFLAPALARWWTLARRAAWVASVEAQATLGRDEAAVALAAELLEAYPRDRALPELYAAVQRQLMARVIGRGRRRLARARRLAAAGAYDEALAEVAAEMMALPAGEGSNSEDAETLADGAADLRLELRRMQAASQQLNRLLEQMRELGLAGKYGEALELRRQGEFVDPRRRVVAAWDEIEALVGLMRQNSPTQTFEVVETSTVSSDAQISATRTAPTQAVEVVETSTVSSDAQTLAARTAPTQAVEVAETSEVSSDGHIPNLSADSQPSDFPESTGTDRGEGAPASPPDGRPVEPPPPPEEPAEPPAPFDLDDWLSNVTELDPEDGETGNES